MSGTLFDFRVLLIWGLVTGQRYKQTCEALSLYSDLVLNALTPQMSAGLRSSHLIYS